MHWKGGGLEENSSQSVFISSFFWVCGCHRQVSVFLSPCKEGPVGECLVTVFWERLFIFASLL